MKNNIRLSALVLTVIFILQAIPAAAYNGSSPLVGEEPLIGGEGNVEFETISNAYEEALPYPGGEMPGPDDTAQASDGQAVESEPYTGDIAEAFSAGTGTEEDPYIIVNTAELALLASLVNSGAANGDGTFYSTMFYRLGADIVINEADVFTASNGIITGVAEGMTAVEWDPIGNYASNSDTCTFRGVFDGCGHTVSGLYINSTSYYKGLFGYISGSTASVKNVGIVSSYIKGDCYVGGVVAYNNRGTLNGCYGDAAVTCSGGNIGGVAGYNSGTVIGCFNTGTIQSNGAPIGGVVGCNNGTTKDCYSTGSVSLSFDGINIGPIVGDKNPPINCYYLADCGTVGSGTALTAEQFESSDVSYLLNTSGGVSENSGRWGHDGTKPVFASDTHQAVTEYSGALGCKIPDISWYNSEIYEIDSYPKLLGLSRLVNSGVDSFEGKAIELTADIVLRVRRNTGNR